jgi:L-iditol 2-dehydrogenase
MDVASGALAEPLGVAVHANNRANLEKGSRILVLGDDESHVVIADIDQSRLGIATSYRFADSTFTIPAQRPKDLASSLEIAKGVSNQIQGKGLKRYDAVFECTGAEICLQTAIYVSHYMVEKCC